MSAASVKAHFVEFYSPGTFVAETTVKPIDAWAAIERELGRTICKREWVEDGVRRLERIPLDRLPPDLGRYGSEPDISCGIICQSASLEIEDCDAQEAA